MQLELSDIESVKLKLEHWHSTRDKMGKIPEAI